MVPWQDEMESISKQVVGQSRVYLQQSECSHGECNLGNFFTDAMVYSFVKDEVSTNEKWSNVTMAMTTQGTFRVPIHPGNITYGQLVTVCPWQNQLVALNLYGHHILQTLEVGVASMNASSASPRSSRLLQVSGLRYVVDLKAKVGQRITSVRVRCSECQVPEYRPLDLTKQYRLVVMSYLASGMNGFGVISENAEDLEMGPIDVDAFKDYMDAVGPITTGIENRIQILN